MLVNVDGVNAAFKDKTIEIVEAIPDLNAKVTTAPGQLATSVIFEVPDTWDIDDVVPLIKGTLKKSEIGNIMMFRVTPHGQFMWIPKKK